MEPLNKKERQVNIGIFVLILLLTLLPICAGVYLFARTDAHENELLRTKVGAMKVYEEEEGNIAQMQQEITLKVKAVIEELNKVSPSKDMSGELADQIYSLPTSLKDQLTYLNRNVVGQEKKKDTALMIEMCIALQLYNEGYKNLYDEKDQMLRTINDMQDDITRIKNVAIQYNVPPSELVVR